MKINCQEKNYTQVAIKKKICTKKQIKHTEIMLCPLMGTCTMHTLSAARRVKSPRCKSRTEKYRKKRIKKRAVPLGYMSTALSGKNETDQKNLVARTKIKHQYFKKIPPIRTRSLAGLPVLVRATDPHSRRIKTTLASQSLSPRYDFFSYFF